MFRVVIENQSEPFYCGLNESDAYRIYHELCEEALDCVSPHAGKAVQLWHNDLCLREILSSKSEDYNLAHTD